jgi:hypothetical protein
MPVKKPLQIDSIYRVSDAQHSVHQHLIGYKGRLMGQAHDEDLIGKWLRFTIFMIDGPGQGLTYEIIGTLRKESKSDTITCRCFAYSWPHHIGMGKCAELKLRKEVPDGPGR